MTQYNGDNFGDDEEEVLSRGYDSATDSEIVLISCPSSAINGDGPVFERLNSKTVYILISEDYVEAVMDSAPNPRAAAVQYGMLLGDVMRRGVYYAQNVKTTKKRRK